MSTVYAERAQFQKTQTLIYCFFPSAYKTTDRKLENNTEVYCIPFYEQKRFSVQCGSASVWVKECERKRERMRNDKIRCNINGKVICLVLFVKFESNWNKWEPIFRFRTKEFKWEKSTSILPNTHFLVMQKHRSSFDSTSYLPITRWKWITCYWSRIKKYSFLSTNFIIYSCLKRDRYM